MKNFIVYDDTGEILRSGQCQDEDFLLQGTNVIEWDGYIEWPAKVDLTTMQVIHVPYSPQEQYDQAVFQVKSERDTRLRRTDWSQLPDISTEVSEKYRSYRQALRDITKQPGYPFSIDWPVEP